MRLVKDKFKAFSASLLIFHSVLAFLLFMFTSQPGAIPLAYGDGELEAA